MAVGLPPRLHFAILLMLPDNLHERGEPWCGEETEQRGIVASYRFKFNRKRSMDFIHR
ncbi:hypothetical protein DDI_2130 [Dickeya dianthicola RNS04.9]|nr:hypothetical protein DDI_2130 [Dickeya dianthicola RNS04.9]